MLGARLYLYRIYDGSLQSVVSVKEIYDSIPLTHMSLLSGRSTSGKLTPIYKLLANVQ
jgi:hypothetical protein